MAFYYLYYIKMNKRKIFTIAGGFYFFGEEIEAPEWYIAAKQVSMFRWFEWMGLPGVACGKKWCSVKLDSFEKEEICYRPISAVYAILPSINLYDRSGTTLT